MFDGRTQAWASAWICLDAAGKTMKAVANADNPTAISSAEHWHDRLVARATVYASLAAVDTPTGLGVGEWIKQEEEQRAEYEKLRFHLFDRAEEKSKADDDDASPSP